MPNTDKDMLDVENLEVSALSDDDLESVAGGAAELCSATCAPNGTGCTSHSGLE